MNDIEFLKKNGFDVDASLELLGDIDMYNETLHDFIDESKERLDKLNKYFEACDMGNYAILVHSIKSDSKYLGFKVLAELSYNHEMESKQNNIEYIKDNYSTLISEYERVINIVNEYFGK